MFLPASSSMWMRVSPTRAGLSSTSDVEPAADADRCLVHADLVALREVRVEVVLAREARARCDACSGSPARPGSRTRRRGGSAPAARPAWPRQTGQTCVFGAAPNAAEQPQKIFDSVSSSAWTSSPITASMSLTDRTGRRGGGASRSPARTSRPVRSTVASSNGRPMSWRPIGRPVASTPQGTTSPAGRPGSRRW